ncbi:uncharacterized protein EV154DRAFT_539978 [Mucor mucedo]|uniref:uncharacterized protein n=1 Tax=Mucor mucedo TaxID=29922 RepID=UPI00221E95EB|nr:uncharacterized protein EV154DRAFT_539978 [Mucor mucedo]KAI7882081.1 hypothetical protein EV154DRAFT_539978 [Mucor mucedo]
MYLQTLANRTAQLAITNIAASVALSAKLSIIQRYFYGPQQTLHWHVWFGRLGLLQALYHATYQLQFNYERQGSVIGTVTTNIRHITGTLMLTAMMVLLFGSHPVVRLLSYRLFRWTHISSFFVLVVFGCLHHWSFYLFYVTVLVFWVTDQIDRSYSTKSCKVESLPGEIVKLTYLYQLDGDTIQARISRPLGRGFEFEDYESVVLVAEGMGITPWISVLDHLQHATARTRRVHVIWSVRSIDTFYAFEKEFKEMSDIELRMQLYITGLIDPEEDVHVPDHIQVGHRPQYQEILTEIQQEDKHNIAMGICTHEESMVKVKNIGLFYSWEVKMERFEL